MTPNTPTTGRRSGVSRFGVSRSGVAALLMAAAAVLVVAPAAEAQPRNRGGGGFGGFGGFGGGGGGFGGFGGDRGSLMSTVRDEATQAELKLTDEQKKQITELNEASRPSPDAFSKYGDFRTMSEDERAAATAEMRKDMEARRKETESKLKAFLSAEQAGRLQQLAYRNGGARGLLSDDVVGELKISEDQKTKMQAILDAPMDVDFRRQGGREEMQKLREERNAKVMELLTPEQKASWEKKLGPPPAAASTATTTPGAPTTPSSTPKTGATDPSKPRLATFEGTGELKPDGTEGKVEVVGSFAVAAKETAKEPATGSSKPSEGTKPSASTRPGDTTKPEPKAADAKKPGPAKPVETLSFNFKQSPWSDVLKLFAEANGLTLDLHDVPPGTFTYYDPNEYTPVEALDVLNGYLLQRGYILVRRNNFLVSRNIDDGIPPNLVPVVRPIDLAKKGNNELLSVVIPLGDLDVTTMSAEIEAMLGPQGKVVPLKSSHALLVQDIGSNLRRVSELLSGLSVPVDTEALTYKSFPLKHISATDAERHVRSLFGLDSTTRNVSAGSSSSRGSWGSGSWGGGSWGGGNWGQGGSSDGNRDSGRDGRDSRSQTPAPTTAAKPTTKMHVASDLRGNRLLATATPTELKVVEEILKSIDDPENPEATEIANNSVPTLRVYKVEKADAREVTKTIDAIMPGIVVNEDGRNGFIHIRATAAEHREVDELIRRLDGAGGQSVDIIHLAKYDAVAMANLLNKLFEKDGTSAPTIQGEPATRTLMVKGSSDQIAQIRKTLLSYGEDGTQNSTASRQKGKFRSISLGGRDGESMARRVEQVFNGTGGNSRTEIKVIVPSNPAAGPERRVPSEAGAFEPTSSRDGSRAIDEPRGRTAEVRRAIEEGGSLRSIIERLAPSGDEDEEDAEPASNEEENELANESGDEESESDPAPARSKPEKSKPEKSKLVTSETEEAKPAAKKPASAKPAADKSAAEKPKTEKPKVEKPKAEKPAAAKPEKSKPAATKVTAVKTEKTVKADAEDGSKPIDEPNPAVKKPAAKKPAPKKPNLAASESAESEKPAATETPAATEKPAADPATNRSAAATASEEDAPQRERARVTIEVQGENLLVYSSDEKVLDEVEALLEEISFSTPVKTTWTVFYLRSAGVQEAATMLEQLVPNSSVSSATTGGSGILDSVSNLGGRLMDLTGLNGSSTDTPLRIIPDPRSNSLFVSGSVAQVRDVEQFLKILDASELPGTLRDRVPRTIDVKHADVLQVAEMIREVYKDYLEDQNQARSRNNPFQALMGGGGATAAANGRPAGIRLTLAVDTRTSQLIVSCDDSIFREISQLVADRDTAAFTSQPTVRIASMDDASRAVIQSALTSMSPKISVSTSGSSRFGRGSDSSRSSDSGNNSSSSGQSSEDAMRDAFRARMMQQMGSGGSPFGGGFPGGSSGSFGRGSFGSGGSPFGGGGSFGGNRGSGNFGGGNFGGGDRSRGNR